MNTLEPMAMPQLDERAQQLQTDLFQRRLKMGLAVAMIVGASSQWHAQVVAIAIPASSIVVAALPDSEIKLAPPLRNPLGFHPQSKQYRASPALEQVLLDDKGAQKTVAETIAKVYKISPDTAKIIVEKSIVASKKHEVDPFLLLALMGQESSYNPKAVSSFNAQGLMQVIPKWHGKTMLKVGVPNILSASIGKQIELGTAVFKEFLGTKKPVELALQHYNQGAYAKDLDPNYKYAKGVLSKHSSLKTTVSHYVEAAKQQEQEQVLAQSSL